MRVGIWRIFDLMDELGLPLCHLLNSTVCESQPQIIDRIKKRGDEVVGHGRTNSERQSDLDEAGEKALIEEATSTLTSAFGRRPARLDGALDRRDGAHARSHQGGGLQLPHGLAGGRPAVLDADAIRPAAERPVSDRDQRQPGDADAHAGGHRLPADDRDQFETMLELSEKQPLVCGVSLHTFVVGQPFRFAQLRKALVATSQPPPLGSGLGHDARPDRAVRCQPAARHDTRLKAKEIRIVTTASLRVIQSTPTLREMTADTLREAIFTMHFKPNDRLVERDLCDQTGVSRTCVREALRHLESEGLVERRSNKGLYVTAITPAEAQQIYEVRGALEPALARLFVERASDADIKALRQAVSHIGSAISGKPVRAYVQATGRVL